MSTGAKLQELVKAFAAGLAGVLPNPAADSRPISNSVSTETVSPPAAGVTVTNSKGYKFAIPGVF